MKRILVNVEGMKEHKAVYTLPSFCWMRLYDPETCEVSKVYAVIIADDNLFEGM